MSQESLLERKSEEATIARHLLGVGLVRISTIFFFITMLHVAAVCYIRRGIFSFFRPFFSLSCAHLRFHTYNAQISSSCFPIQHKYLLNVLRFSTNLPKKALRKQKTQKQKARRNEMKANDRKTHWVNLISFIQN